MSKPQLLKLSADEDFYIILKPLIHSARRQNKLLLSSMLLLM